MLYVCLPLFCFFIVYDLMYVQCWKIFLFVNASLYAFIDLTNLMCDQIGLVLLTK